MLSFFPKSICNPFGYIKTNYSLLIPCGYSGTDAFLKMPDTTSDRIENSYKYEDAKHEVSHLDTLSPHPRVVEVLSSGKADENISYLVMKRYRKNLDAVTGSISFPEALSYFSQINEGLRYVHSKGVVHRDIAPKNFLLDGSTLVLSDFGLARNIGVDTDFLPRGTNGYGSPERYDRIIDPAVDYRSFGVVILGVMAGMKMKELLSALKAAKVLNASASFSGEQGSILDAFGGKEAYDAQVRRNFSGVSAKAAETIDHLLDRLLEPDYTERAGADETSSFLAEAKA
ncbi:MAG: protein kinase family protein [Nanoarchaeota archaeon]|nr:protein kinase family protein [Nanoarchaeota archaeon]